ncbi:outer membrane lipoprotein chaperone LolA [Campylobacter sp. MIT 12-8780]|uniref:LolA-like outer membrane lipoprotein chaperone n=1 Tax=unclassified Campylobacter TaxID=2593542 RepID=UPI00115E66FB|nr:MULTISPECIES: LolA-like outer membrane lipoprotein chaperone [unclassified Campylobacter]NDJ27453.1 outer membrane lipoprotein chaperone LolA [Campylobacter sp. MIT 19-121]TQR41214.1 outer membrane lipoprotein chaperone LolA [Campylobacter sp. MIT 12-8780]
MFKNILFLFVIIFNAQAFDINYKNFSSDFVQSVENAHSKIDYKGSFIITQTKAFWDYKEPNNKQIFINNQELVILEPDLEQAIISTLDKVPNLSEIFKSAKRQDGQTYIAKYEQITYTIKLKNDEISSISYKDDLDNKVLIELSNQKRDTLINEEIFKVKIPANFDILR